MAQRLLILSDAGVPLLSCSSSHPQLPSLPFATTGLLSALHSSSTSQHLPLSFLLTSNARITFHPSSHILLILTSHQTASPLSSHLLLSLLTDAIVLLIGRSSLNEQKAMERLKRKLRTCNSLLSSYLESSEDSAMQLTVGLPEYAPRPPPSSPFSPILDRLLTSLSTACSTQHVALYLGHRLLLPSSQYALLHPSDLLSISQLLLSSSSSSFSLHDQPIFLSHSLIHGRRVDGSTAYRLLYQMLSPTLAAVLMCGPNPGREEAEREMDGVWEREQGGLAAWDGEEEDDGERDRGVGLWMIIVRGKKVMRSRRRKRQKEEEEEEVEGQEEEAGEKSDDSNSPLHQLLAFYHSSIDLISKMDRGEAYMEVEAATLWAVRSGDYILYARIDGRPSIQQSRQLALDCLRRRIDRRQKRSSVLPIEFE